MRLLVRGEASSLYGAIVMSMILVIFVSLYSTSLANLARQGEAYREALRGYVEAYSEDLDLYLNTSSGGIYAYSSSGARVIYLVIGNRSSIAFAMNTSIEIPPGSRVEILPRSLIQSYTYGEGYIAVLTERGRIYIYRWGYWSGDGDVIIIPNTASGIYYAVRAGSNSYIAYYYDGSGARVNISTYRWDIDPNYIIFQSPINGTIYLEKTSAQLNTLDTKAWFNPPSVSYDKPRITISFPPPWSITKTYDLYYIFSNTTSYSYNPSIGVIVAREIAIAPTSFTDSVSTQSYLSQDGVYQAYYNVSYLPSDWKVVVLISTISPGDLGIVGVGGIRCYYISGSAYEGSYYSWKAQTVQHIVGPNYIEIRLGGQTLYIPVIDKCWADWWYPPSISTPIHIWLYGFAAQGPLKIYSNTTIYPKQGNIVVVSNGNKIYFIDSIF
ncbi:MAG: hypothetical protein QXQ57_07010 [Sulfolobales archaeon]